MRYNPKINRSSQKNQDRISYLYAFFLVYVTPISIPLAALTIIESQVSSLDLVLMFVMYCLSGLGITLGYHRLVTHRAYQTTNWLKRVLLIMGTFAMQGSPASWASIHIQHHRYADKPGDPHSPKQLGFWYAHCGWIFHDYRPDFRRFGKWLIQDKEVKHVSRYYLYYSNLGLLLPLLLGGLNGFIWAGLLRVLISSHVTWSINSVCHRFGKRPYHLIKDSSANNGFIALLSFGEGWHHNHHRYLQMPFLAHRWYQIDLGKWVLLLFKSCRLAWGFKIPKELRKHQSLG